MTHLKQIIIYVLIYNVILVVRVQTTYSGAKVVGEVPPGEVGCGVRRQLVTILHLVKLQNRNN